MKKSTDKFEPIIFPKSIYCYAKEPNVLKNKHNIKNEKDLEKTEKMLSIYQLSKLQMENSCSKKEQNLYKLAKSDVFDISQYCAIHRFIFGELYSFAGNFREENIMKDKTPFCRPEFIYTCLNELLNNLKNKIMLVKNYDEFLETIIYFYAEVNVVHPFREGNGRCQREFFRQFVEYYSRKLNLGDLTLDYSLISINPELKFQFLKGSILSVKGDLTIFREVFRLLLVQKSLDRDNNSKSR